MKVGDLSPGCLLLPVEKVAYRFSRFIDKRNIAKTIQVWKTTVSWGQLTGPSYGAGAADVFTYIETLKLKHSIDGSKTWHILLFQGEVVKVHGSLLKFFNKY